MKSCKKILIVLLLCVIFLSIGCVSKPIKVGNIDPQFDYNSINWNKGRLLQASASGFQLLLLIPININNRQERAYQIIRDQAGSDFITDVKIKESWTYAFVGTIYTTAIEAIAYPHKTEVEKSNSSESFNATKQNLTPPTTSDTKEKSSDSSAYAQKLRELKKLKDDGLLTDKEYEMKRKAIIDGI
jgi:hypothetical protein